MNYEERLCVKEFVALRAKTCVYLMDNDSEEKKAKGTNKCVIKRKRFVC